MIKNCVDVKSRVTPSQNEMGLDIESLRLIFPNALAGDIHHLG